MERPSLRSRPAEGGDPLPAVGPEGPADRIQAGRLRNVRRPDARRARDLRRAVAQAPNRDRAAAPARGALRPGWPTAREPGVGSRSRAGERALTPAPHAHGRDQAGGGWSREWRSGRRVPAVSGWSRCRSESVRRRRPQRPVPLRQWQEVQEVPRGGLNVECGMSNAELQRQLAPGPTLLLTFRNPHSPFRIVWVPRYLPSPPMLPPCRCVYPSTRNATV